MITQTKMKLPRNVLRIRIKYIFFIIIVLMVLQLLGFVNYLFEKDFKTEFTYPYDGDIQESVYQLRNGKIPNIKPINYYNYTYIYNPKNKCVGAEQQIRIIYLIKSDPKHFTRRSAIRSSWGWEKRFSDVEIRRVFLLGYRDDSNLQKSIEEESHKYLDIIQANYTDSYFNNTIKTMMGFKWAANYCSEAKFYMLVDDDYYVSTKNVLRFLRNPTNYPKYIQEAFFNLKNVVIKKRRQIDFELPDDVKMYSGFVFNSKPQRYIFSRWQVTLMEYPYNKWPSYVTAGAVLLSREAFLDMYYTSFFTRHFRFDDIYLGLLAYKAKIDPFHSDDFHFYRKEYSKNGYTFTVASHGFDNPMEILQVWNEQRSLGNA